MSRPTPSVAALRDSLALGQQAESSRARPIAPPITLGVADVDARLGGGLARAALHELFTAGPWDVGALTGFAVMLAVRAQFGAKPVIWVREDRGDRNHGRLYAQGLVDLGADPNCFMIVHAPDTLALLRAAADSVKCSGVGAVFIEPWGKARELDLTASRRLSMAAAQSGVLALVLRSGAEPSPSAALTRWRIACAPSTAISTNPEGWVVGEDDTEMDSFAPGHPAFDIEMLRHRGGLPSFTARLEWNCDRNSFAPLFSGKASLSGDLSAVPSFGTDPDGGARAA
jgi:protein ImuA